MWRKQIQYSKTTDNRRNTSTYVEKTLTLAINEHISEKHLHVCGENSFSKSRSKTKQETPPRMWRKQLECDVAGVPHRNTSTYVEKTYPLDTALNPVQKHLHVCGENMVREYQLALVRKHLHVCGENTLATRNKGRYKETPPRMWRKHCAPGVVF